MTRGEARERAQRLANKLDADFFVVHDMSVHDSEYDDAYFPASEDELDTYFCGT